MLSASWPGSAALKVYEHFEARCRSVHLIPFDPHLAERADVDFGLFNPSTFQAYMELAAAVAEKFPRLRGGGGGGGGTGSDLYAPWLCCRGPAVVRAAACEIIEPGCADRSARRNSYRLTV